ncbi:MAG: ECF-type sigma factor [Pyrinomonadaceae bacterium]
MEHPSSLDVTRHLSEWRFGNDAALARLVPFVTGELKQIARRHLRRENRFISLQTSELINEAYVRLIDSRDTDWQNRCHFFAVAAKIMRNLLTDRARRRNAKKVPGFSDISIASLQLAVPAKSIDLLKLDEALKRLEEVDERKSRIVELKFFGGLTAAEIAGVLGISEITVKREWLKAKAFLYVELKTNG